MLRHKKIKHKLAAIKSPGIEDLLQKHLAGDDGLTLVEYCPFGVIGQSHQQQIQQRQSFVILLQCLLAETL